MRILLVEDDYLLGDATKAGLTSDGYTVDWFKDGIQAELALESSEFDGVVLDLGLPGKDGLAVLKSMRNRDDTTPVIILTARDLTDDKVKGLDAGADDYLIKPFDLSELSARLRALIRRSLGRADPIIKIGSISLNPASHEVRADNDIIELSQREFSLLQLLMENVGRVLSRSSLEENIYGWNEEVDSNALEVHIHHLRKKLGSSFIQTIRGVGYTIPVDK
ncbi:MAG: response regulator [Candidatus Ruthia sp.]|nr:response regulator [Candidatus Ruthturnera sp.]MBT4668405.1 response regulator [Candidatus Ruthturnera sp.]